MTIVRYVEAYLFDHIAYNRNYEGFSFRSFVVNKQNLRRSACIQSAEICGKKSEGEKGLEERIFLVDKIAPDVSPFCKNSQHNRT